MSFVLYYFEQLKKIISGVKPQEIEKAVVLLKKTRDAGGRLFLAGCGGGAAHASHAACDFRKVCGIEAHCVTDNVAELTARINDDGWESSLSNYLRESSINSRDCLLVFSVGGGSEEKKISLNLVDAMKTAKKSEARIIGIVGRDGGFTATVADACIIIPPVDAQLVTPHTEGFQSVVSHLLISHPDLQRYQTKWESTELL